jgi:unsaturated rhamnogalacturonyl hydrolase
MIARPLLAALLLAASAARAQTTPAVQLGEGTPQPNNRPIAIPDASPRLAPTARPWSVRFVESVMRRNPQVHRRWDYTAGVVLGAIERVGLARRDTAMLA